MSSTPDIPETNKRQLMPGMRIRSLWPVYIERGGEFGNIDRLPTGSKATVWLAVPLIVIAVLDVASCELNVLCLGGNGNIGWIHSGWVAPDE